TKRRQFEHRLAAHGIDPALIARMRCPIGIDGVTDKSPEVIAIAVAAQMLQAVEAARAKRGVQHNAPLSPCPTTTIDRP
ncbi:MAG TPA: XdhC family protein, partial [Trinickia sp.]|nr:XdhC family protein [Trinickia sp.]